MGPAFCSPPVLMPVPNLFQTHLFNSSSASGIGGPTSSGPGLQVGKGLR